METTEATEATEPPEPPEPTEPPEPPVKSETKSEKPLKVSCSYKTVSLGEAKSPEGQTKRLNDICNEAFKRAGGPYVENFPESTLVALATDKGDQTIWGLAFCEPKKIDSDPTYFSQTQFHVHSIAVDQRARQNGLCKGLVKSLIGACKSKDPKAPMYLNVRVTKDKANIGGIKCYQKNGFQFVGVPPTDREDGPNAFMVRNPSGFAKNLRKTIRKKRKKTRSRRSRQSRR